ncbi:putative solute-binding protein [Aquirhabdus parva]|uniref:RND transporter n=1 Tax=Aquirhabdus parva TaxID=2283318 RepID=A0A345P7T9_9GAMM|nr:putative solute-binding protein [Aquirhabdus parva]AXI03348.1 hypothetical protein HYN46_11140 [Aquirhabdus parva]
MTTPFKFFAGAALLTLATSSYAQKVCVFDPLGTQGDIYSMMKDYALAAKQWGADITLKPYTDERIAAEDFKAGQCDGVSITGVRARQFNNFTGSIDAAGGLPNNNAAKAVISLMASPKVAPYMLNKGYEVVGVSTLGSVYIVVNDRSINSLLKVMGKRFGVLDYDKAEEILVQKVGAQAVSVDLTSIGGKFNNGQVDVIAVPAMAFKPLELSKGIGSKGAIVRFPVAHVTSDILIRPSRFPDGYGQKSRTWVAEQLDRQLATVARVEKSIEPRYWMDLPANDKAGYVKILREARLSLARDDVYNKKMMSILKKVRCGQEPTNFECTLTDE